ncbi:MAG: hypothetical protein AB1779_07345, partial [Candidatus Thermoplasmatota archaeon]
EKAIGVADEELKKREKEINDNFAKIDKKMADILAKEKSLELLDNELKARSQELKKKGDELTSLDKTLKNREEEIKKREELLKEENQKTEKMKEELEKKDEVLKEKEQSLSKMEEEIKNCPYCNAKNDYIALEESIKEAEELGVDIGESKEYLEKARTAIEQEKYDSAASCAKKAIEFLKSAKDKYYCYGVSFIISSSQKVIKGVKERNIDVSEAEKELEEAKKSFSMKDYKKAEELAKKAERSVIEKERNLKEMNVVVEVVEREIRRIQSFGVNVSDAEKLLEEAKICKIENNYSRCIDVAKQAEKSAKILFGKMAEEIVIGAREGIETAKKENRDTAGAELFLQKAELRLRAGDYETTIQYGKEASRLARIAKPLLVKKEVPREEEKKPPIPRIPVRRKAPPVPPAPQVQAEAEPKVEVQETFTITTEGPAQPFSQYICPKCKELFVIDTTVRPVKTKCPWCKAAIIVK